MTDIQQYQRFFDELAPRLETAHTLERELDAHLARRFNAFDYLRTDELGLSRIIADLLNPQGKHGQGSVFLKLLLDGCDLEWTLPDHGRRADVNVEVEKTIKDDRRIDVCVSFGGNCLAIENKPYAGDQPNQIKDYLDWLRNEGFQNHALIYLSPSGERPAADSIELASLQGREDSGHFKIMPYHSAEGYDWEDGFDEYRRHKYTIAEWLSDCRKNCEVDRLGWFLREAGTFCKTRFGGNTVGSSEQSTIGNFVVANEERWQVALEVHQAMPEVIRDVFSRFMPKVWDKAKYDYTSDHWCFWDFYSPRKKACLGLYRKSWKSSSDGSKVTHIRLEAWSRIDRWTIGVRSDNPRFGRDQEGYIALKEEFGIKKYGDGEAQYPGWVWWDWVKEHQNWTEIIPKLYGECERGDGEVMRYFAEQLVKIADVAIPIIDEYE